MFAPPYVASRNPLNLSKCSLSHSILYQGQIVGCGNILRWLELNLSPRLLVGVSRLEAVKSNTSDI